MRKAIFIAGAVALATAFGASVASAQNIQASEKAGVNAKANVNTHANVRAKTKLTTKTSAHVSGKKSMASANTKTRLHGSHSTNFCPPGQAKKPGKGSRFQC